MRANLLKIMAILALAFMAMNAPALVNEYSFGSSVGTYTEITGGSILGSNINDDESFNAIPLGFTFTFNGIQHTQISIQTDAFLAFGPTVLNSTLAISSATGTNNIVSALNRDLMSRPDGELSYLLTGTAPNRVFVVQWKNYRRIVSTAVNDVFNFQIQLHENGNQVVFAYGAFTLITVTTAQTVQVGLRGDSNADFNNRSTTTNWAATTAGTAANASCTINATVFPANGLIFTFAPVQSGPPLPAQSPVPANNAGNVSIGTNLSWVNGGGVPTGYKVYLGTNNPPTNIVNGTPQTGTVYDHPVNLSYSTQYYWQIVPYNQDGDAIGCPVWSFSTLADPTITIYPYNQSYDTVTPPGLPAGWSVLNLNADAYTWESIADPNANTPPNAMRIRFNPTLAMNDWLISPPMQFVAGALYRIRFYYRASSASFTERLALYLGSEPTAAAMSTQLFINDGITNTAYQLVEIDLPISANSISYLGFKGFSAPGMEYLFLDSFSIQEIGPSFVIDPVSHAIGNVNIGESANQVFTITNPGGGNLMINNITISGSPMMSLSNLPALPVSLNHAASTSFTVLFTPTIAGEHNAS
ncbi:MAG: choice-of-anchor D domain-containing protein, partial [Candidatus Cloacimonadaceae bacterium]|nr:choice-of-anchor D domain-containing protein [Candidatus Cloacimonadaceae bacterium]